MFLIYARNRLTKLNGMVTLSLLDKTFWMEKHLSLKDSSGLFPQSSEAFTHRSRRS